MRRLPGLLLLFPLAVAADFSSEDENGFLVLDNGSGLRAVVAPEHGGELTGFSVRFDGVEHELIYRAMEYGPQPGWRGKAPLLWPAVGVSLAPGAGKHRYRLDGEVYRMPFHGFARDTAWRPVAREASPDQASVTLEMTQTEEWKTLYPFDFVLRVAYRLDPEKLSLEYSVSASQDNARPMPFVIGNHVTFRAPLIEGPKAGALTFRTGLPDLLVRNAQGAFDGETRPSPYREGWHAVSGLPHRSAVSLGGKPGPAELTVRDPSGLQLRLVHRASREPAEPAVRFNLWADTEAGFFSPEPWVGTQNALNTGAGLLLLQPGDTWTWTIDIIPSRAARPGDTSDGESP